MKLDNLNFAVFSRRWRKRMGVSREQGAKLLGLPVRSMEGWELGRMPRYPKPLMLAMIQLLGVQKRRATRPGGLRKAA